MSVPFHLPPTPPPRPAPTPPPPAPAHHPVTSTPHASASHIDDHAFAPLRDPRGHPRCEPCSRDPRSHCFYEIGLDAKGRHVIYSNAARAGNKVVMDNMMHMAYELERVFDGNRKGGKLVWWIDLRGMGMKELDPRMGLTVSYVGARLNDAPRLTPGVPLPTTIRL